MTIQLDIIYDETQGTIAAMNSDLNHETSVSGSATIPNTTNGNLSEASMSLKGRGNMSWKRAKKSYQLKLDEKANVLGVGKAKNGS